MTIGSVNEPRRVRAHLDTLARQRDLEDLCARCGDCCRFAFWMPTVDHIQRFTIPDLRCRHLVLGDDGLASCAVYADRHALAPWCSRDTVSQLSNSVFSPRCGYIQGADWLRPSRPVSADQLATLARFVLGQIEQVENTLEPESVARFRLRWSGSD